MTVQFYRCLKTKFTVTISVLSVATLAACTPADQTASKNDASSTKPALVSSSTMSMTTKKPMIYTSTNIWGAIAKTIGGEAVEVVTAIDSPNQDPHEYQASATDKLTMQNANVVLVNGGGYDDWALSLAEALTKKPAIINAFELSAYHIDKLSKEPDQNKALPKTHDQQDAHSEINEHVFYSLDTAQKVATAIANQLAMDDPAKKDSYLQNAQVFSDKIACLKTKAMKISANKTQSAIATESVSDYLLADMGIKNITPFAYVVQSETEAGVSAKVLQETKNALVSKPLPILVINAQTEDATARQLIAAAKSAQVATVEVSETLPANESNYITFMNHTINKFNTAVNGAGEKPLSECD